MYFKHAIVAFTRIYVHVDVIEVRLSKEEHIPSLKKRYREVESTYASSSLPTRVYLDVILMIVLIDAQTSC